MSRLDITIDMNNAAFQDDPANELSRILNGIAYELRTRTGESSPSYHQTLLDFYGNPVGKAEMKPD